MADRRTRVKLKTAADWTSTNSVLAPGEVGYESDTNKAKVGNGSSSWNSLAYLAGGSSSSLVDLGVTATNVELNHVDGVTSPIQNQLDSKVSLTALSVTQNAAGTPALTYNNTSGAFTYTPPDLSGYQTTAAAFDGDYASLTNAPTIPADVSDLTDTTGVIPADISDLTDSTNLLSGGSGSLANAALTGTTTYDTLSDGTTTLTATVAELNTLDGITATTGQQQ